MRILIVEDERYIARAVAEVLKKSNYIVDLAHDGESGLDCALSEIYDIIVLDIMLPNIDGLSVLKEIRKAENKTAVIMLTAKGDLEDKIKGLDLGADDYLAKPFHTEELLARIRALSRRTPELHNGGVFKFEDITLSPTALMLRSNNGESELTHKEAQILEILIANARHIVQKETMIEKIWGYDADVEYNQVEKHISALRKKILRLRASASIRTVRGVGYTLEKGCSVNAEQTKE
jgi:DNA-binding response OmpR family regulator